MKQGAGGVGMRLKRRTATEVRHFRTGISAMVGWELRVGRRQLQRERAAVIAVHDSAGDSSQWRGLIDHVAPRFDVLALDMVGHGAAGAGRRGLPDDADLVLDAMRRLGRPVHLIGHGYGSVVILQAVQRRPGAVASLTLLSPAAFPLLRGEGPSDRRLFAEVMTLAATMAIEVASGERGAAMERYVDYWHGMGAWRRSSRRLQERLLGRLDRVLDDLAALAADWSRKVDLGRLACPALIVVGLEAPLPVLRAAEIVAEALPRGALRLLAGAGHMVPLTDPHLVDPMITAHLAAAEDARQPVAA